MLLNVGVQVIKRTKIPPKRDINAGLIYQKLSVLSCLFVHRKQDSQNKKRVISLSPAWQSPPIFSLPPCVLGALCVSAVRKGLSRIQVIYNAKSIKLRGIRIIRFKSRSKLDNLNSE